MAYAKLYANDGALTPGVDPKDTVDAMSLKRIEAIIEDLRAGTYLWKPTRRTYIAETKWQTKASGSNQLERQALTRSDPNDLQCLLRTTILRHFSRV